LLRQSRVGFSGMTGIDMSACLHLLVQRGHDPEIAALLLPFWEEGLMMAVADKAPAEDG
jgi:hypothetical protein